MHVYVNKYLLVRVYVCVCGGGVRMHLFTHLWHVGSVHTFVRERERGTDGDSRCKLGELERGKLSNASECVCMRMHACMHVCVQLHAFVKERGADVNLESWREKK